MKTLLKIAWRSLWRNRRRTLLTGLSVFIALVLSLFTRSMQLGSYAQMISAGVNQTGYMQVHDTGYQENQTIDRAFFQTPEMLQKIENVEGVTQVLLRAETFALASFGEKTKGIMVSGVEIEKENSRLNFSGRIIRGKLFENNEQAVVIGDKLAQYLGMDVGDSLVLIGQGYHGITAYGIYRISGIFHFPSNEMNGSVVYMGLNNAQLFIYPYEPGILTTLAVYVTDEKKVPQIRNKIQKALGPAYEVISWKTILSDMLKAIKIDNLSGQLMLVILYVIAAFGILSTVLMMTMEKRKQYAVMISIGMKRSKLVWVSIMEVVMITFIGIAAGVLIMIPVIHYLHAHPIPITGEMAKMYLQFNIEPVLPFSNSPAMYLRQTVIIAGLSMLSVFYPVIYLLRFNVLNAFRH